MRLLKAFEKEYNYKIIKPEPLRTKRKVISSTMIRKLLEKGNLKLANKFLDRNWTIEGVVSVGRKMGRKIGFPTCNIDIKNYVISKPGVYSVKIYIPSISKSFRGIANLGYRPTFKQKKILLEVNIFNFSGNLYNKKLSVEFIKFIRGEKNLVVLSNLENKLNLILELLNKVKFYE